ncbi:unnamed protein product [Cylindrotheca closterium]|uniref:FAD/NAD(P)-binding domain-containing protein n=1 Tax=Cylindrotheca closterium TaxID=2856 RepID=A0AAD2G4P0_9STRA|nr:unnamed protein product [Cylindrotheca closterium]
MNLVDCVIIGGSYGGLSAALCLGRCLRQTVVIDEGLPCNRFTPHSQNFLTRDGSAPDEIASIGKQQIVDKYKTVQFLKDRVVSIQKKSGGDDDAPETTMYPFQVQTASGNTLESKTLLFASGVTDTFPSDIPGFEECWGTTVIHCPYCHGYEFHSQPTAMFMAKERAMHMLPLVRNLTADIKIVSSGTFDEKELALFEKNGVQVMASPVQEIQHENGHITTILLKDGTKLPVKAMYAGIPFELNAKNILQDELKCELDEHGFVKVDGFQKTTVDGVYAVGDATTMFRTVANAVSGGNKAASIINMGLCNQEFAARS